MHMYLQEETEVAVLVLVHQCDQIVQFFMREMEPK